jgi:hypothetical protein
MFERDVEKVWFLGTRALVARKTGERNRRKSKATRRCKQNCGSDSRT